MDILINDIIIISLLTFSLSSIWLVSPGPIGYLRKKFISYFANHNNRWLKEMQYLGICQLCSGFWIAIIAYVALCGGNDIRGGIVCALICTGISWALGSFVMACLWIKAALEDEVKKDCL